MLRFSQNIRSFMYRMRLCETDSPALQRRFFQLCKLPAGSSVIFQLVVACVAAIQAVGLECGIGQKSTNLISVRAAIDARNDQFPSYIQSFCSCLQEGSLPIPPLTLSSILSFIFHMSILLIINAQGSQCLFMDYLGIDVGHTHFICHFFQC